MGPNGLTRVRPWSQRGHKRGATGRHEPPLVGPSYLRLPRSAALWRTRQHGSTRGLREFKSPLAHHPVHVRGGAAPPPRPHFNRFSTGCAGRHGAQRRQALALGRAHGGACSPRVHAAPGHAEERRYLVPGQSCAGPQGCEQVGVRLRERGESCLRNAGTPQPSCRGEEHPTVANCRNRGGQGGRMGTRLRGAPCPAYPASTPAAANQAVGSGLWSCQVMAMGRLPRWLS